MWQLGGRQLQGGACLYMCSDITMLSCVMCAQGPVSMQYSVLTLRTTTHTMFLWLGSTPSTQAFVSDTSSA